MGRTVDQKHRPADPVEPTPLPQSLIDAPWVNIPAQPAVLAPPHELSRRVYDAPYTPRVNHCPAAKKIAPARSFNATGERHQPFSNAVLNNCQTAGVNTRYAKVVGASPHNGGNVDQVYPGTKFKIRDYLRGQIFHDHPNRCAVSAAELATRVQQFAVRGRLRNGGIAQKVGNTTLRFESSHRMLPVGTQWQCTECAPLRAS